MYTWNRAKSDFWGNGTHETKEEAIQEAKDCGCTDFYVGECEIIPLRTDADPDRIMEELDELYSSESGCDDFIYDGVSDEDRKWFADKLSELVTEFNKRAKVSPEWFRVISEEHIHLQEVAGE